MVSFHLRITRTIDLLLPFAAAGRTRDWPVSLIHVATQMGVSSVTDRAVCPVQRNITYRLFIRTWLACQTYYIEFGRIGVPYSPDLHEPYVIFTSLHPTEQSGMIQILKQIQQCRWKRRQDPISAQMYSLINTIVRNDEYTSRSFCPIDFALYCWFNAPRYGHGPLFDTRPLVMLWTSHTKRYPPRRFRDFNYSCNCHECYLMRTVRRSRR